MADAFPYNSEFEAQFDPDRAQQFIIQKLLQGVHTCALVRVLAVDSVSDRVGFVTVQPMVEETDTAGVVIPQSPIYRVPFMRYQGGLSAVILDPAVGDTGLCIFAERDITNVKTTLQSGPAATDRRHSSADGLYIGGVLNPDATQWVKFQPGAGGIDIHTPANLSLSAGGTVSISSGGTTTLTAPGGFVVNANMTLNGTMSGTATGGGAYQFAGAIQAPDAVIDSVTFSTHKHTGVQTGGGTSGGPTN